MGSHKRQNTHQNFQGSQAISSRHGHLSLVLKERVLENKLQFQITKFKKSTTLLRPNLENYVEYNNIDPDIVFVIFFSKIKMVKELFVYSSLKCEIKFQSTNIYETLTLDGAFCQMLGVRNGQESHGHPI